MSEMGADTLKSFTVAPGFGGYFRGVRSVAEFSHTKIVLLVRRGSIAVEGEGLEVSKYFEGDTLIRGDIKVIKVE